MEAEEDVFVKMDKALAGLSEIRGFGGLGQHPCIGA
jgi:hypothetical protein